MLRQASNRNQRGKAGLKMKNVLQICLLIAVCIWLVYQMKHSHDKKETFKETNAKGGGRLFDIRVFGRKDLPHIAEEVKNGAMKAGHGIRQGEIEDGGGSNEELEEDDDGAVHKAREISFNEDDVSSEVAHTVQEASQASGERSFKADDASSAVAHVIQPNESDSENGALMKNLDGNEPDDKKKKDGEIRDLPDGYQEDEFGIGAIKNLSEHETDDMKEKEEETQHGARKNFNRTESDVTKEENSSISGQGSSTADNDTISTKVGTPIPDITSFQNRTTVESKNEGRPLDIKDSQSIDAGELVTNSTYFSKHKIYFQKNSTTVSVELVASPANLTVNLDPTNSIASQNQTSVVHEEMNSTKMQTQGEEKPNLENKLMEQKESSATNGGDVEAVPLEAGNSLTTQEKNREVNGDQSKISDIQNRADSRKQEAVEK